MKVITPKVLTRNPSMTIRRARPGFWPPANLGLFFQVLVLSAVMLSGCQRRSGQSQFVLVKPGQPHGTIYLSAKASETISDAAEDFARVIKIMSGASLPVVKVDSVSLVSAEGNAILLGQLAADSGLEMNTSSRAKDGFRYKVQGSRLLVVGESDKGVACGIYNLLESVGCGWYVPGPLGEVIPQRRSVTFSSLLDHSEVSDSIHRRFWYGGKNNLGTDGPPWLRRNKGDHVVGSWRHAWHGLVPPETYFEKHPEYFGLLRGERKTRQLCTTNPDTIRIAAQTLVEQMDKNPHLIVLPAGPNDGGNLCECEICSKLDTPGYFEPSSGKPACPTRIFKFGSDLAEITSKTQPDKDLGILVYSEYSRIPLKIDRLHPNVFPMIAPIRRCRLHGPGNPLCKWNQLWKEEIEGWGKKTRKMGFYIYNYNLADTLVPLSKVSFYKRLVEVVHQLNVEELAWVFETIDSWSMHAPHLYLSARLSWDSHLNIDREMNRFFRGFYGAAAIPMKRYWTLIDQACETTNVHTGSQYGLHKIWTDKLLRDCRQAIKEAKALAANPREAEAVAMTEAGLRCAEYFIGIHKAVLAFDFPTAGKLQDELKAHVHEMSKKTSPSWAHERYAYGYYSRFTGRTVSGGAALIEAGGTPVVKFRDQWRFTKDEAGRGAEQKWFTPDYDDSGWLEVTPYTQSWDDIGLGWYQGDGWYRQSFEIAKVKDPENLKLWFGGFDYNVDVYLNGHPLGEKRGFATPAEFDKIHEHLKFGGRNVLAVRVSAGDLAELGTGGIMKPVMIYRAGLGKEKTNTEKGVDYIK